MRLSDLDCRNAKPGLRTGQPWLDSSNRPTPYKPGDGKVLYLLVQPNGLKLWQMSYTFERKQRSISFGAYPRRQSCRGT
jgi:hypothetical protein